MIPPDYQFNPYDPAVQLDPYPHYAALRDIAPVVRTVIDGREVWVLSHDRHIRAALTDWETFSSVGGLSLHPRRDRYEAGVMIATDPRRAGDRAVTHADHGELLRVVGPHFGRRAIGRIARPVRSWVHSVVGELVAAGRFDAVTELARLVPARVVGDLVGLPESDRHRYVDWAVAATSRQGPADEVSAEVAGQLGAMRGYVSRLGAASGMSLTGVGAAVFAAANVGGPVTREDAVSIVWGGLIIAGLHTTVAALTWSLVAAARYPEQWQRYRVWHRNGDDARLAWVDELLRHEAIFPNGYRVTTREADVDGYKIPANSRVLILYGSANRDPARWHQPDRFRPDRGGVGEHLGLGTGPHRCLGRHLARLEVGAVMDAAAGHQVSAFSAADDRSGWAPTAAVRGWASLPVTLTIDGGPHDMRVGAVVAPDQLQRSAELASRASGSL